MEAVLLLLAVLARVRNVRHIIIYRHRKETRQFFSVNLEYQNNGALGDLVMGSTVQAPTLTSPAQLKPLLHTLSKSLP